MSSSKYKTLDELPTTNGPFPVSGRNPTEVSFQVTLSGENPFEKRLIEYLQGRVPVQVGRLRFAVGEKLLSELLLRGADSLESEYPGVLGLQDLLSLKEHVNQCSGVTPAPPTKASNDSASAVSEVNKPPPSRSTVPTPTEGNQRQSRGDNTEERSEPDSAFINSEEIPRLNLSGFDLGSSPVTKKQKEGPVG